MEYERKGVTITWEIENVRYFLGKHTTFRSPSISVEEMNGTKWRLELDYNTTFSIIDLILRRESGDDGPKEFGLDYEFSVNTDYGTHLAVKRKYSCTFVKGLSCPKVEWSDDHTFDSIIVRCEMWPRRRCISKNCHFIIQTPVKKDRCEFIGVVEKFSSLSTGVKKTLKTVSSTKGQELMTVNLILYLLRHSFRKRTSLNIETNFLNEETDPFFGFQVIFLDFFGNKTDFGEMYKYFVSYSSDTFMLPVTKEDLIEEADLYLPNDTLSLHCEVTFYNDKKHKVVKTIESETDFVSEAMMTGFSRTVEILTATKSIPCDVKIQTVTEIFRAHTEVLKAQSTIFEAMFRTNMKELVEKSIDIDDVEAETVKRMLVFLYSGTLDKLDWKEAVKLYVAANKYQIVALKQSCASLLEQNIDISNCIVLLRLADMHQNNNLKTIAQDFIAENIPQILSCDHWRDLEKEYPQMAIDVFHALLRKNKIV